MDTQGALFPMEYDDTEKRTTPYVALAGGVTSNGTEADNVYVIKKDNIVFLKLRVYMSLSNGWNLAATLPSGYYPAGQNIEFTANNIDQDIQYNARFETDGRIQVYNPSSAVSNKRISMALTYILG